MPGGRASCLGVPTRTYQLLRLLRIPIHLSKGAIFPKLCGNRLLPKFFYTFLLCLQKAKYRDRTRPKQKKTPMTYGHHSFLGKPRMVQVKVMFFFGTIEVLILKDNFLFLAGIPNVLSD